MSGKTISLNSQSISDLVTEGKYDWANNNINNINFPLDLSLDGQWECDLFDPEGSISSELAHNACSVDGWIPASAAHHLAFCAAYPHAQRANPIVSLGSSCHDFFGSRCVLVSVVYAGERRLFLDGWNGLWDPSCRFLRVRHLATPAL
jgi:hypothetical protein